MTRAHLTDDEFGLLASLSLSEDGLHIFNLSAGEIALAKYFEGRGLVQWYLNMLRITDAGRHELRTDGDAES